MRPPSRMRFGYRLLLGIATSLSAACEFGPFLPEFDPRPDLSGTWTLSMAAAYPAGTVGADGECGFAALLVELARSEVLQSEDRYDGVHTATRMECVGFTAAATQASGLRDTTVFFPADSLQAAYVDRSCLGLECSSPYARISFAGLALLGHLTPRTGPGTSMNGTFSWTTSDTVRVTGEWQAVR